MHATNILPIIHAVQAIETKDLIRALEAHGGSYDFSDEDDMPSVVYETDRNGPMCGLVTKVSLLDGRKGVRLLVDDRYDDQYYITDGDVVPGELTKVTEAIPEP